MEGFIEHFDSVSDESIKQFLVSFAEKQLQPDLSVRKAADRVAFHVFTNCMFAAGIIMSHYTCPLPPTLPPHLFNQSPLVTLPPGDGTAPASSPTQPSPTPHLTRAPSLANF